MSNLNNLEDEPTEEELLAELERETKSENMTFDNNNGSFSSFSSSDNNHSNHNINNNNNNNNNVNIGQLTTFQENIISTGSGVSIALLIILIILFIIQFIRKSYSYLILERSLKSVANPLNEARPQKAEDFTPISMINPKSYAVYNTSFDERDEYILKKQQKKHCSPSVLKKELKGILLRRAIKCIERASAIQRDSVGIRKNWNQDLLPKDVWDDFNSAQRNIQIEIESVLKENMLHEYQWSSHKNDIFGKAKEEYAKKVETQKAIYRQQRQQMHRPPNAKHFGNGLQSGFLTKKQSKLNNNNNDNNLSNDESSLPTMQRGHLTEDNPSVSNQNNQNIQNIRKRKKRRFPNK